MEPVFRTQFHTAVVGDSHRILLQKVDLDDAFKDKRFPEGAKVELIFESWDHADAGGSRCEFLRGGRCVTGVSLALMR